LLYLICRVKGLDDKKISPIFKTTLLKLLKIIIMEKEITLMRMEAEISAILAMLQEVKEQSVGKVYNTQELSEYLKVGKAVIDKLRQDGELEFSKLGRTIVYTQKDIDKLLERNHFSFVA
jgi:excisionase family DNA binding protein